MFSRHYTLICLNKTIIILKRTNVKKLILHYYIIITKTNVKAISIFFFL